MMPSAYRDGNSAGCHTELADGLEPFNKEILVNFHPAPVNVSRNRSKSKIIAEKFFHHIFFNCCFPLLLPSQKNG
jgi:hypothetical protein